MSVKTGQVAEDLASRWLATNGFKVIERNWRTRWCEIDIIARQEKTIHFVEVKYRRSGSSGSGFEAITFNKAQRLRRAGLMWLSCRGLESANYQIDIMAISGFPEPKFVEFLPNAIEGD